MIEENDEKTSVRLVGTGIWTRDPPNSSLVRYHGATSLGNIRYLFNLLDPIHFYYVPYILNIQK